jgi:rRNA maturation endonuclease Nob1
MKLEVYQCLKCGGKFTNPPGPQLCPYCGHCYIKWLTYKEKKNINERAR